MKNFMINIRRKSILVLLSLISAILLLFVGFTMSKYVIEKQVGSLTLNLTSADILLPGQQFSAALGTSVTKAVFGLTDDYENEIDGIEPINVDVNRTGKIKLYVKGTTAYILSNRKIYANPNSFHMFYNFEKLTAVDFSNFDTGIVKNMRGMFRGCSKLTERFIIAAVLLRLTFQSGKLPPLRISATLSMVAAVLPRLTFQSGIPKTSRRCTTYSTIVLL